MTKIGISLPIYNTALPEIPAMAKQAEDAGFDSAWSYEIYSSPYVALTAAALATERIALGTAIAHASTRSPWVTANTALDIDTYAHGRVLLGIGMGDPMLTATSGADVSHPYPKLREYVQAIRAAWSFLATGEPQGYEGTHYQAQFPPAVAQGFFSRSSYRDTVPIYLAAMRPKMVELAGEIGDGLLGTMYTPEALESIIRPALARGAAKAGRDPDAIDIVSYTICSPHDDRAEARRRARIHVGAYVALPGTDPIVAVHGFQEEQQALRQAVFTQGVSALATETPDRLVDAFAICGTPEECRKQFAAYDGTLPHVMLHPPSIPPMDPADTKDSFARILQTFRPTAAR
jgi:alkanesulfonate monooxygenase SsuD/methylene tetrahydromethanopterin reductase-like flavin-dependent oxidoreductase (luciferase family)